MFKHIFIALAFLSCNFSQAQDLHIYYDVHNDSLWYMKDGKQVKELKIRKDRQVHFHLVEFNNYIYSALFDATNHALMPAEYGSDNGSFRGFMPQLLNSFFPGGGLPFMNVPIFGKMLGAVSGANPDGNARGDMEDVVEFKEKLDELALETEAMNTLITDINKREKAARTLKGNINYINELCKTPSLAPSLVKELVMDVFEDAFILEQGQKFEVKDVEQLNERLLEIPSLRELARKRLENYVGKISDLGRIVTKLKSVDHGIDDLYGLLQKYETDVPQIKSLVQRLEVSLGAENLAGESNQTSNDYAPYIQTYFVKYMDLLNNDFAYTHNSTAEGRYLVYSLKLFRKDSTDLNVENETELKPVKTIKLKVDTYGEFKLGTSFGVNGIRYGNTPQRFFVKDNVITAVDEDRYAPMLSSFFNLSYTTGGAVTPALSFGMGLPLSSAESTEGLAFFFGPGLYLGRKQTIMLSGGFMFSKVERLTNGLKVGDSVIIGDGILPVEKKFDTGIYFGLAYRMGE